MEPHLGLRKHKNAMAKKIIHDMNTDMQKRRTITSFINNELRQFSLYVCYHRAIPSLVDGFKPSQRKAFHVLRGKKDFVKVQAVAGKMISEANYHHGDASASETVSRMTQSFTGSNNVPAFVGKGSFGSKFVKEASAPRYVFVKPNPDFYSLFNDFELCEPDDDPENPEPRYFLPVVPTILMNGVSGIAVGFATRIFPYRVLDIVANVRAVLAGRSQRMMAPFFSGYSGEITWDGERHVMHGSYEATGPNTLRITEVPVSYDREQYNALLAKLEESSHISSSRDVSKTGWDIRVTLPARGKWKLPTARSKGTPDLGGKLGLTCPLNENITVIDENGELAVFPSPHDLIARFVDFRLKVYGGRIRRRLADIRDDAALVKAKIRFVQLMSGVDFRKVTRASIAETLRADGFDKDHMESCLRMPATNLNSNYIDEKRKKLAELKGMFEYYKRVTPEELYKIDLDEVERRFSC